MSKNRENITWQSEDGKWNIGFYDFQENRDGDDYDSEWDVDYNDKFHWVSAGHASAQQARNAWRGANPGGGSEMAYSEANAKEILELDDQAAKTFLAARKKIGASSYSQYPSFEGTPKQRLLRFVARDLYQAKLEAAHYKLNDYANQPEELIPYWQEQLDKLDRSTATPEGLASIDAYRNEYAAKGQKMIEDWRDRKANSQRGWGAIPISSKTIEFVNGLALEFEELRKPTSVTKSAPKKASATESTGEAQSTSGSGKRYHISPTTGRPNQCSAKLRACPFGGEADHYTTKDAARSAYEKKMGSGLGKLKK
jgi:hypothetical protein